jgi:hypothetical protein
MTFHNYFALLIAGVILVFSVPPSGATYAGDLPLVTVFSDEFNGDYWYSTGNSTYSGSLTPGTPYYIGFPQGVFEGVNVRYQRLYVYWTWSRLGQEPVYPEITIRPCGKDAPPLRLDSRYIDNKGFAGTNDFYSGMDSYLIGPVCADDPSFSIENTAGDERSLSLYGAGILSVFEDPMLPLRTIRVLEGADLLFSNYGVTPEMATSIIDLNGTVDKENVLSAKLFLVAPSGGYSRSGTPGKNVLMVNRIPEESLPASFSGIFSLMFPGFSGKTWQDVFSADENHQIGTEEKDITRYLRNGGNKAEIQDRGDYLQLTNAVLEITLDEEGR